jgi:hypothetical protein
MTSTPDSSAPGPSAVAPSAARPGSGLGVAALVVGVASLVAALSFVLFPLGFLGGIIAILLGVIAIARRRTKGDSGSGKVTAGIICGVLAVAVAVLFGVRVGTLVARNTSVFTSFDNCIAKAGDRGEISACIAHFSNDIRP